MDLRKPSFWNSWNPFPLMENKLPLAKEARYWVDEEGGSSPLVSREGKLTVGFFSSDERGGAVVEDTGATAIGLVSDGRDAEFGGADISESDMGMRLQVDTVGGVGDLGSELVSVFDGGFCGRDRVQPEMRGQGEIDVPGAVGAGNLLLVQSVVVSGSGVSVQAEGDLLIGEGRGDVVVMPVQESCPDRASGGVLLVQCVPLEGLFSSRLSSESAGIVGAKDQPTAGVVGAEDGSKVGDLAVDHEVNAQEGGVSGMSLPEVRFQDTAWFLTFQKLWGEWVVVRSQRISEIRPWGGGSVHDFLFGFW